MTNKTKTYLTLTGLLMEGVYTNYGPPAWFTRVLSFIWACGPPIDMKIRSSRRVYDQSCVDGKGLFTLWMK